MMATLQGAHVAIAGEATDGSSEVETMQPLDAAGCTLAPGYTGAINCISVSGSSNFVNTTRSRYEPGVSPWPSQICSRTHQWRYTNVGSSSYSYQTSGPHGCILGVLISYVDWTPKKTYKDGSSFCARSKNSHTNNVYSNYACITIKK